MKVATVVAPLERVRIQAQREAREDASKLSHWLAFGWVTYMFTLAALTHLPWKFVAAWVAINALTYVAYAADKSSAKQGKWRTPESRLRLLALAGGWPAAAIAQQRLRHKSSKGEFRAVFWMTVIVNCAAMIWLATNGRALLAVFT